MVEWGLGKAEVVEWGLGEAEVVEWELGKAEVVEWGLDKAEVEWADTVLIQFINSCCGLSL